jgi:hypothetical protein
VVAVAGFMAAIHEFLSFHSSKEEASLLLFK